MRKKIGKRVTYCILIGFLSLWVSIDAGLAQDAESEEDREKTSEPYRLEELTVRARHLEENIVISPGEMSINLEDYKKAGVPHTVIDILKDRAIIDFRGSSDLSYGSDDVYMRGFDTRQFTTAVDGLAIQKTGGYWGGHFVDYSIIPMEQIESIEILPGPHSALYEGKSFAGVINIKTKAPKKRETPEVGFKAYTSYGSLNTYDSSLTLQGGGGAMDYVLGIKEYHTDGYLKNSEYDLSTVSGRVAWMLPNDGYISVLGAYSDKTNEIPCENDPNGKYYDDSYPVVERDNVSGRWRDPAANAARKKKPYSLRFNWNQPTDLGEWSMGAYYAYEDQSYQSDISEEPLGVTSWSSWGAKIQNEFYLTDAHLITVGFDTANLSSRYTREIVRTYAGYIQDRWRILPRLVFQPGLRYEKISIWWNNTAVSGGGYANPDDPREYIPKGYDELMPKAFVTYELDDVAGFLRDTSVSVGISRVWTPRATCEVCTWGSGVEMDPTEGYGVDVIFERRVWRNIVVMVDFSRYIFDNYVMWADSSSDYFQNSPWGRRMVGLEDVTKDGVELEINGDIIDDLSVNISFAYVNWEYNGPEGGIAAMSANGLSNRAKYRINAGVTYNLTDRLQFHLDYKHQDKQVQDVVDIVDEDAGIFEVREVKIDSYGVMDFSAAYTFIDKWKRIEKPTLKLFCNNVLDADYVNVSGYPATERTFGAMLSLGF